MSTKRILSLVLAMVMVLGTFGSVFAAEPSGNPKVDWLVEQGYVVGDAGGLRLEDGITRAEVSVIVAKALGLETEAVAMQFIPSRFPDMRNASYTWANGYVNVLNANGYLSGYPNGTFGPAREITYAEVASMLVRVMGGLTKEEQATNVWPTTYLAKAAALGIFDGVAVTNYSERAVRGKIFEMTFNTLDKSVGNNTVIKAIVLENNRVETLGKDEIVVEIIKVEQIANYAKESRIEKGKQENLVIDASLGNVEDLLGQVANFTISKDNKVIKITPDTTYKIVTGPVKATKNKISVNGTNYTVELDERYKGTDERVFRTYHNDNAYAYEDFYQDPATIKERAKKDEFSADYARVTVKNGKVLLIDAYSFEDIAPVQEVKRDGADVYVYNDYRDARPEKFEPRALVMGVTNGKFSRIERKDIKANDVVHVYRTNRMIVRQDAVVKGMFQKVERDSRNDYFAHIGEEKYYIGETDYFRPVYSHDSKAYTTLYTRYAQNDLANFYKEDVTILIDINGDLQLFGANVQYNEGMTLIEQILARGQVKFVKTNDERIILDEDYKSIIKIADGKTTINQRLNAFNVQDLVFVLGADEKIDTLVRIKTIGEMRAAKQKLKTAKAADMNNSFIRMTNDFRYQVLDRTNVFVINAKGKISGTTVAKLQGTLKADSVVEAFVLSDADVTALIDTKVITDRNRITKEANIAHTIVFIDVDYKATATNSETVKVTNVFTARSPHSVTGQVAGRVDERKVDRIADAGVSLTGLTIDDIVSLKLTKTDDKFVTDFEVLIAGNKVKTDSYRVVGGDFSSYSSYEFRRLYLQDATQEARFLNDKRSNSRLDPTLSSYSTSYWLVKDVEEFGTITMDSVITFHLDGADIDVLRVYGKNTNVTANAGTPIVNNAVLQAIFSSTVVQIKTVAGEERLYEYAGNTATLSAFVGKAIEFKIQVLNGKELIYDIVLVGTVTPPANKVALAAAIVDAENALVNEAKYTVATVNTLKAALSNAKTVYANVNATATEINGATNAIVSAITGLVVKPIGTVTATYEATYNFLSKTYAVRIKLSDATKNIDSVKVNGNNEAFGSPIAGWSYVTNLFAADPVSVVVVVEGVEIIATK